MNMAILWRQKKYVQDGCSIYILGILFLPKALSGISWNKIPNSWFKLSPFILRKNEEQHLKHSEGSLPKPLTNKRASHITPSNHYKDHCTYKCLYENITGTNMPDSIADIIKNVKFLYLIARIKECYCFSIKLQNCTNNAGTHFSSLAVILCMP